MDTVRTYFIVLSFSLYIWTVGSQYNANSGDPLVLWTQHSHRFSKIRGISANSTAWEQSTPFYALSYLMSQTGFDSFYYAIGYDATQKNLVYSDLSDTISHVFQHPISDSLSHNNQSLTTLLSLPGSKITGLACDWLTGAIYFTEEVHGWVGVLGQKSGGQEVYRVLFDQDVDKPQDIAIDPVAGLIFWTDAGIRPSIFVASTEGSSRYPLIDSDLIHPMGITVDPSSRMVYWVDRGPMLIERNSYEGGKREMVYRLTQVYNVQSLALFQEYIFVTCADDLALYIINHNTKQLHRYFEVDAKTHDIVIVAPPTSMPKHECQDLGCQHMCLNLGELKGRCTCKDGYFINPDGSTCSKASPPQYIYTTGKTVHLVNVTFQENLYTTQVEQAPVKRILNDLSDVRSLGIHYQEELLYFASMNTSAIQWENVETEEHEWKYHTEITVQTGEVLGLAVDWLANNLYWSDHVYEHIMVCQLDGRYHSILLDQLGAVRGLAVSPTYGRLFWATDAKIETADTLGRDRTTMVNKLWKPQSVVFDSRHKRLYWTDIAASVIQSIDVEGGDLHTLEMKTTGMYGLTVFQSYLTWTKHELGLQFGPLTKAEIFSESSSSTHADTAEVSRQYYDVTSYSNYLQPLVPVGCNIENGGCQQLCFPLSHSRWQCGCAIGFTLSQDQVNCLSDTDHHGDFLLFVDPYHKQIYQKLLSTDDRNIQGVPISRMTFPVSIDFDTEDNRMYWIDRGQSVIASALMDGTQTRVLLQYGADTDPTHLTYDLSTRRVYYIDQSRGSISWLSSSEQMTFGQLVSGLDKPSALAVDKENQIVYWAEQNYDTYLIQSFAVDGSTVQTIVTSKKQVTGLTLYSKENLMYYCTMGEIGYIDLNSTQMTKNVVVTAPNTLFHGITVTQQYIYFIVWNQKVVTQIRRSDGGEVRRVTDSIFARITDIRVVVGPIPLPGVGVAPPVPLIPILASVGALLLLGLLLLGALCAWFKCRKSKKGKGSPASTPGSERNLRDSLDNEIQWMDFENPTLYDIRSANGAKNVPPSATQQSSPTPSTSSSATPPSEGDIATSPTKPLYAGAAKTPLALVSSNELQSPSPDRPSSSRRFKKKRTTRKDPRNKSSSPNYDFDLTEKQKVATVLQRIVGRMRSKLSSVRWTETDGRAGAISESPPDITLNMPVGPSNGLPGPEKGMKSGAGPRLVFIPPKLHDPPRGWAPASHNVPRNLKTSWGKAKTQDRMVASNRDLNNVF